MILRRLAMLLFIPAMLAFGSGVYLYLGSLRSTVIKEHAQRPTVTKPKFVLPGTVLVVQAGRLYKLNAGTFTEIGPQGDWTQPTPTPDHTKIVAVSRGVESSDLYLLDAGGKVIKRLTRNDSRTIEANHWVYFPRVTPDGTSLMFSYDNPKHLQNIAPGVDFSIWTMPLNGTQSQARRRTDPYWYTGGDVSAIPLRGTGILYVKHTVDPATGSHSQIWYQSGPGAVGKALTAADDNCIEPSLSPDGTQVVMVCSQLRQTARMEIASFDGSNLGPVSVLLDGAQYAMPTWSPDGKALIYYAPAGAAGHFELWYLALPQPAPTVSPAPSVTPTHAPVTPLQVTQGVDLTATSPPAWY